MRPNADELMFAPPAQEFGGSCYWSPPAFDILPYRKTTEYAMHAPCMPKYHRRLNKRLQQVLAALSDAYARRMDEADVRDAPTSPLFHYTTWAGFEGIMTSRSFWFTSVYQMKDATELTYGFDIATRLLQAEILQASIRKQPSDWLVREFCMPLVEAGNLNGIKCRFEFYSASFGQRDEPHQWKEYGEHGRGIAIGLSEKLFKPEYKPHAAPHERNFLGKVIYDPTQCEARHRKPIRDALDTIAVEAQLGSFKSGEEAAEFCRRLAAEMHIPLICNSITTKERKWEPENETRLFVVNDLVTPKLAVLTRPGDGRRYVEIPLPLFEPGMITEVIVGPHADTHAENQVETFVRTLGMPDVPNVTRGKATH